MVAAKLDNSGLFYFDCVRVQGVEFHSGMWMQHRRAIPTGRVADAEQEGETSLSLSLPAICGVLCSYPERGGTQDPPVDKVCPQVISPSTKS